MQIQTGLKCRKRHHLFRQVHRRGVLQPISGDSNAFGPDGNVNARRR